jgi:hypothetical protein
MLTFLAFLREDTNQTALAVVAKGTPKNIDASAYAIQFVLPDGKAVELNKDEVHAKAVRFAAQADGLELRLIDVLKAGVVRAGSDTAYQVAAPITSAQAQFIYDRAITRYPTDARVTISIADVAMAERNKEQNAGIGPIEINDADYHTFDLDHAKPAALRNWVNSHVTVH